MNNRDIKNYYDVIIVGAGIAGIECAKNLGNSMLSVLIIERNKGVVGKVCAGGVLLEDLEYIPESFLNFDFQRMFIHYKDKMVVFPADRGIISTINRKKLLNYELKNLRGFDNIEILTGVLVSKVISGNSLELSSGKKLDFRFLVGADGANSIVRKYLNLPKDRFGIVFQCITPRRFENFEIYLDDRLFPAGYLWIFPHKNHTSVGCGSDVRFMNTKQLRGNFDLWLKDNNIDVSGAKFEAAVINYDYRGYRFENIFLTGDAAGLTSGITGKGMYSAFLSGKQVAGDILRKNDYSNLIGDWLRRKKRQERYISLLKNAYLRGTILSAGIRYLSSKKGQEKVIKLIT